MSEFQAEATKDEKKLKEITEQKHKLENKTNEQETYIKKQLVSQTAATFAKKKELKANEMQEKKLSAS